MGQRYKYCKVQEKVVPIEDVVEEYQPSIHVINDEMPPTRNPLNSKEFFTSKSKLREEYKRAGVEEIGNSYQNGYNPHKEKLQELSDRNKKSFQTKFRENLNRGR